MLVVNRPQGLRDMNEKVYTAWFPQCCAPTLITRDMADMGAFLREHGKIVVQAAATAWAGARSSCWSRPTSNARVVFETLTDYGQPLRHRAALPAARSSRRATRGCC